MKPEITNRPCPCDGAVAKGREVQLQTQVGGQLNPDWVEWLMGWPIGWTASKPLATGRFRQWQSSHGKPCRRGE